MDNSSEDDLGLDIRLDRSRRSNNRREARVPHTRMSISIPVDTHRQLTAAAALEGRKLSELCAEILAPAADKLADRYGLNVPEQPRSGRQRR